MLRKFAAIISLLFAIFAFWQGGGLFTPAGHDEALARQEIQELTSVAVEESKSGVPLAGKRIDQVDVGQWVLAENPIEEDDLRFGSEVTPSEWRLLELRAPKKDGSFADVRMLRPYSWLQQQWEQKFTPQVASLISFEDETGENQQTVVLTDDLTDPLTGSRLHGPSVYVPQLDEQQLIGQTIYVSVPECGIDGDAHVLSIGTCPNISPRPGPEFQVVTATFHHHAATVLDLYIDDLKSPIGTTTNHPFWSVDQQDFVRADELEPGETLRNANGSLTHVKHVSKRPGTHDVFNLEVQIKHTYHIADGGVLVHNGLLCDKRLKEIFAGRSNVSVIGRDMKERVKPFAEKIGGKVWNATDKTFPKGVRLKSGTPLHSKAIKNNKQWIRDRLKNTGDSIVNIGTPKGKSPGDFVKAELEVINKMVSQGKLKVIDHGTHNLKGEIVKVVEYARIGL